MQQSIHTRRRKPEDEELDRKLQQMNKAVALSDPFVNYIIHHESKWSLLIRNSCENQEIVRSNVGYKVLGD